MKVYSVAELAAQIEREPNTIYDWVRKGKLPRRKTDWGTLYFTEEDLEKARELDNTSQRMGSGVARKEAKIRQEIEERGPMIADPNPDPLIGNDPMGSDILPDEPTVFYSPYDGKMARKPLVDPGTVMDQQTWAEQNRAKTDVSGQGENPWDRRPTEPVAAYQAFVMYLHQPYPRSLKQAYGAWKKLVATDDSAYSTLVNVPRVWSEWKILWNWDARADEYDKAVTTRVGDVLNQARARSEWEALDGLLIAMELVKKRLRIADEEDLKNLTIQGAGYLLPRLAQEIRMFMKPDKEKTPLEDILKRLPTEVRQQLLIAINIDQVNIGETSQNRDGPVHILDADVVEGEVRELPSGEEDDVDIDDT